MRSLSIAGTAAMFLVGGGILVHGIPVLHHGIAHFSDALEVLPGIGVIVGALGEVIMNAVIGVIAGAVVLCCVLAAQRVARKQTR